MEVCFVLTLLWDKAGKVQFFFLFQMPLWHRIEEKYQRMSLLLSLKIHSTHTTENVDDISGSFSETIPKIFGHF